MAINIRVPITTDAKDARDDIKDLNSELKQSEKLSRLADKELQNNANNAAALDIKYAALNEQLRIQHAVLQNQQKALASSSDDMDKKSKAVDEANEAFKNNSETLGKNSQKYLELKQAMEVANAEFEITKKRASEWDTAIKQTESSTRILRTSIDDTKRSIEEKSNAARELGAEFLQQAENARIFGDVLKANLVSDAIVGGFRSITGNIGSYLTNGAKQAELFSVAQQQLATNMGNTMNATQEQIDAIHELTLAQQDLGVVSQTAQIAGAQQLAMSVTQKENLQAIIPLMNDVIAQQNGVNATSHNATHTARELGRAMDGNVGAMKRLGLSFSNAQMEIMKTGDESERVAVLLEVVSSRVGGVNEALAQTDVGRQAHLNNILSETQQRIGEIYNSLRAEFSAEMLPAVEEVFTDLLQLVEDNRDNIAALMGVLQGLVAFLISSSSSVAAAFTTVGAAIASMRIMNAVDELRAWITTTSESIAKANAAAASVQALTEAQAKGVTATKAQAIATAASEAAMKKKVSTIKLLTAAMKANPLFMTAVAGTAIFGIITALNHLNDSLERQVGLVRDLSNEYDRLNRDITETDRQLSSIARRLDELLSKNSLTPIEKSELETLKQANIELERTAQLLQLQSQGVSYSLERETIDILTRRGGMFEELTEQIGRYSIAMENADGIYRNAMTRTILSSQELQQSIIELSLELDKHANSINGAVDGYEDVVTIIQFLQGQIDELVRTWNEQNEAAKIIDEVKHGTNDVAEATTRVTNAATKATTALQDLIQSYHNGEISTRDYVAAIQEMRQHTESLAWLNPQLAESFQYISEIINHQLANSPEHINNLRSSTTSLSREIDLLRGALDEMNDTGNLSVSTAMRLIEAGYEKAVVVSNETGLLVLNTEAYRQNAEARLDVHAAELQLARSQAKIRLQDEMEAASNLTHAIYQTAEARLADARAKEISINAANETIAGIEAQIAILDQLRANLDRPLSLDRQGRGGNDPNRDRLQAWENYYRNREEQMRTHLERERHFNRLSTEEEIAAKEEIKAFLKQTLSEIDSLYFTSDEERARIRRDVLNRLDRYERQHFTLVTREENNQIQARLSEWENYYRYREEQASAWLNRERFFNRLSFEDEMEVNQEMLTLLSQALDEVNNLYFASAEERARIIQDLHAIRERYERATWAAQRQENQEIIRDEERAAGRREELAQREIDRAGDIVERHQAYAKMRIIIIENMYKTLSQISNNHFLNERERRRMLEDTHWEHARNIERIDERMANLRRERLIQYAAEWRTTEMNRVDDLRTRLDQEHNARRDAFNRELTQLREHYAQLDTLERQQDRNNQISNLEQDAAIWANHSTLTGQRNYRRIREQIDNLRRQEERELRGMSRQQQEDAIRAEMSTLDDNHRRQLAEFDIQREALQAKYEQMRDNAASLAKNISAEIMEAGAELTDGLNAFYETFGENIEKINKEQLTAGRELATMLGDIYKNLGLDVTSILQNMSIQIQQFAAQAKSAISQINFAFGTTRAFAGASVNNITNHTTRAINNFGDSHFYNQIDINRALHEIKMIDLR